MEILLGILTGVAGALAPLMWAVYEYLKLLNITRREDKLLEYAKELTETFKEIDDTSPSSNNYEYLIVRRNSLKRVIESLTSKSNGSSKGNDIDSIERTDLHSGKE